MQITKRYVDDRMADAVGSWLKVGSVIYIAISNFSEKDTVKGAGFRWFPDGKMWWTNDPDRAAKLSEWADPTCKDELDDRRKENFESVAMSRAATTDRVFPKPEGLDYYPFQKAGIAYAIDRPGTLIGDDMGLGKTIQAIGLINTDEKINTVLVVCPASLKVNWLRECEKWLVRPMKCAIASSQLCSMPEDGFNVVIINYDICKKYPQLQKENWDLIILDECHRLKNYKAQRTVFIYGGKNKATGEITHGIPAKRRLALTGTPICNRPSELYPTLAYLSPEWKTKWGYFMSRYCGFSRGKYGCDTSGATNLDELQEVLRRSVMIRRLKYDVLRELPAKTRQIIEIEPDEKMQQFIDAELDGATKKESVYEELKAEVEIAKTKSEDEYRNAVTRLRHAMSVSFEELSRLRHDTAVAKIPFVVDYLKDRFEEVEKIIVFAWHHDVIDAVCSAFPGESVHLTGSDNQEDRQAAVDGFQSNPKIKLFVGSITAAGVGLTLTAASLVIFVELDWVPGNITQAEDRAHRIGQKDAVTVQHLVLDGSIDSKMAKTLIAKQEIIEKALDVPESAEEPVSHVEQPATASLSRQKIEQEALGITGDEIQKIHTDIKYLAGRDGDYAHTQNGIGFNKIDTRIGHELASMFTLTAKQAVLARKILKKYSRQLQEVVV